MYASVGASGKLGLENNWTIVFVRYGNRKTMMIIRCHFDPWATFICINILDLDKQRKFVSNNQRH